MRYYFTGKISGEQFFYANVTDAILDSKRMFGEDVNFYIIRSLLCTCTVSYTHLTLPTTPYV